MHVSSSAVSIGRQGGKSETRDERILRLHRVERLSHAAIAERLSVTAKTVRNTLRRQGLSGLSTRGAEAL